MLCQNCQQNHATLHLTTNINGRQTSIDLCPNCYRALKNQSQLPEFEIETAEFMDFQKILLNYNYRKNVVGTAKRGGGVIYHYHKNDK